MFSPVSWIRDTLAQWREIQVQGSLPAHIWIQRFNYWHTVIQTLLPAANVSSPLLAILMGGSTSSSIESELTRMDYNVFDPNSASEAILQVADQLPNGGAAKSSADGNRVEADMSGEADLNKISMLLLNLWRNLSAPSGRIVVYVGSKNMKPS